MKLKKILTSILSATLLCSMMTSCNAKTATKTIEEIVQGHNGDITISVTFADEKIDSVEVKSHSETDSIAGGALTDIPKKIVDTQSISLDTVSGATVSSQAILDGVKLAIEKAGLNVNNFMNKVDNNSSTGEAITLDTEVVVIGAGAAGFSAATKISESGGKVVLLEKMPFVGGNTVRAGGAINAADPEQQNSQTMSQSEVDAIVELTKLEPKNDDMKRWQESVKADIDKYIANGDTYLYDSKDLHKLQTFVDGDYLGDTQLIEYLCENSLDSIKWLEEKGVEFKPEIQAVVGAVWKRSHALVREDEKGIAIIEPLQKAAIDNGTELYLNTKAEELIVTDRKVTGVKAINTETNDTYTINATKGVIIATGGFAANVEMRTKYNTSGKWANLGEDVPTSNHPGATGDGIIMAQAIGADVLDMEQIQLIPTYLRSGGTTIKGYINNTIYVNQNGERYINEDGRRDELSIAALNQPGSYFYVINDHADALNNGYTEEVLEEMASSGKIWRGDTIEELAEAMGADPIKLKNSVDSFNNSVDGAKDEFGRKVFDQKIENGPFYASSFSPAVHHTMGGLRVNTNAQVLDTNGTVIPGLYAAGEVTGGLHGANRLGGNAIPDCIVNGMNAGEQILK